MTPPEYAALRARLEEVTGLYGALALLGWDQNTYMPPAGAQTRGDTAATLEKLAHERLVDPEVGRLLDRLEPWAAGLDPDSDDARLIAVTRQDHEKAVRVPPQLAAEMSRASALGYSAWLAARSGGGFGAFRDALARQLELRQEYAACFDVEHPYDALLDDFEPGTTTAGLRPLFGELAEALPPLVAATAEPGGRRNGGVFDGPFPVEAQRVAVTAILEDLGFDTECWRLDTTVHPFAQSPGPGDIRLTTRYDEHDFADAFYSALHEFGHGLYEAGIGSNLRNTTLHGPVSLGIHESQSRTWENLIGRSRPFCQWLLPRLRELLPGGFDGLSAPELFRAVNCVQPSLIRTDADETTYNLHVLLRFELEVALMEGSLAVDDVPAAWNEAMQRLLGVDVPDDVHGVLQDVHWGQGALGYFPTYTLGNLMAAQMWTRVQADLGDVDAMVERGDFAPVRAWLREHVHSHGRKFPPRDLLRRVTGEELRTEPFLAYLRGKLGAAGVLAAA